MHAYCLFCETQKCAGIARQIERRYGFRCISPEIIQRKWVKGVPCEQRHDWLPGYIFLYTEAPVTENFWMPGMIRWLGGGELQNEDAVFADMLYRKNGVLGTVRLAELGDRCTIDDPQWNGISGTIVRMDRGRKRCCVEFLFDSVKRTVWLGYELVKPAADPQDA